MLVTVESGKAVRVAGDPDHPFTRGFLCAKVNRYVERTYHPDRLQHPLRRRPCRIVSRQSSLSVV
jgi:anaerobic selenocysteine-containing dehydrogenase